MAYSDYGAFVWLNGKRREDKEDVAGFASDEKTFGTSSENVPSGARIWVSLLNRKDDENLDWVDYIHHGVLGDDTIRVICHKQGLPNIYEATEDRFKNIKYYDSDIDYYDYEAINFEYKGYKFCFKSGSPYYAEMITPTGDKWECKYDYWYGAGFEGEDYDADCD